MSRRELRDVVLKKLASAKRKEKRLRDKGVDTSKFTIIRDVAKVRNYNTNQLNYYLGVLESFLSRKNTYVRLQSGWVHRDEWAAYKAAEKKQNRKRRSLISRFESQPSPDPHSTVAQYRHAFRGGQRPERRKDMGPQVFHETHRKPSGISSPKALRILTEKLLRDNTKEGVKARLARDRRTVLTLLNLIAPNLVESVERLSDNQFMRLWWVTNTFAQASGLMYTLMKAMLDPQGEAYTRHYAEKVMEVQERDMRDAIEWAKKEK